MAQIKSSVSPAASRFADDYDIYVDYGKGRPIKIKNTEDTFLDVEKFFIEQSYISKLTNDKSSKKALETNVSNKIRNTNTDTKSTAIHKTMQYSNVNANSKEQNNVKWPSTFTPNRIHHDSRLKVKPKKNHNFSLTINKKYNAPISTFTNHKRDTLVNETIILSNKYKSFHDYYKVPTKIIPNKISPMKPEINLCLRIAVNGASKSLRGHLPSTNANLNNGDFGDDAGMAVENRNFHFIGLADGAGGNRSYGINPADFSRAILAACEKILHQNNFKPNQLPRLIKSAMEHVEANEIEGSSTLCLLAFDKQEHMLTSLNIGDSGYVIYRNNEVYRQSTCTMNSSGQGPRQLFALSDLNGLSWFLNESKILQDSSLDRVKLKKDDLIILSSDGLWNVLEKSQLNRVVQRNKNKHIQSLADDLLRQAMNGYISDGRDDILIIACKVDESP